MEDVWNSILTSGGTTCRPLFIDYLCIVTYNSQGVWHWSSSSPKLPSTLGLVPSLEFKLKTILFFFSFPKSYRINMYGIYKQAYIHSRMEIHTHTNPNIHIDYHVHLHIHIHTSLKFIYTYTHLLMQTMHTIFTRFGTRYLKIIHMYMHTIKSAHTHSIS